MKTEKQITMSLELAKQMLGKDETMDMLIKQNFSDEELGIKPKLPKKWEDIVSLSGYYISAHSHINPAKTGVVEYHNKNILPTKELAEAMLVLCQLLYLRDIYNDGWQPDWSDGLEKYVILIFRNELNIGKSTWSNYIMSFKTEELRDEFHENFKDLLEIAKPLL